MEIPSVFFELPSPNRSHNFSTHPLKITILVTQLPVMRQLFLQLILGVLLPIALFAQPSIPADEEDLPKDYLSASFHAGRRAALRAQSHTDADLSHLPRHVV